MLKLALACIGGGVVYLFLRQATIRQRRQVAVANKDVDWFSGWEEEVERIYHA
jgi:hypothetical protein